MQDCIAQYVQIGSGTSESSNYSSSPVNIYFRRTVAQFIYTADELTDAGVSVGVPINEIGFYVTEAPIYSLPGYRVQVKNTTQADVSTPIPNGGWSTIVNSFTYTPTAGGYDMISTNGNFTWDGVSNIAVQVCWSRVNPSWSPTGKVRIMPQSNGYIYRWTDNNGNSCGNTPNTVTSSKPQIQFRHHLTDTTTWIGNISTDWFNGGNWSHDVPSKFMTAYIPAGANNMPLISGQDGRCDNLHVELGASLTFGSNERLEVFGDWTNNGALIPAQGTISIVGEESTELNGSSAQNFYNIELNSNAPTAVQTGSYNIQGSLYLNGGNFETNDSVNILSNATGTGRIPEIKGQCSYTLLLADSFGDGWNEGFLNVEINGVVALTYACSGFASTEIFNVSNGDQIDLVYTAGSFESENSYSLFDGGGNLLFSDGPNPSTGTVFSTTSNCSFSDPLQGEIYAQRYIDAGETNWRFLTFPVSGADLEQFDDDFITSGIPGSDYPNWPSTANPWESFYFYEENQGTTFNDGFQAPSSMSEIVSPGQGVWIWCGDTITGTQPFTIDVRGPANTGDINLPVSFNVASGSMDDDGWNMVANPYPCTIDWNAPDWTKTNIENAIYIWNPDLQQYATYVAGVGLNGGSNQIASSQAFMVHADASNPVLTVRESCKVDSDQGFLKAGTINDLLRLKIQNQSSSDELVVRFDDNASNGFDTQIDARKAKSSLSSELVWWTQTNGIDYAVNSLTTPSSELIIPIHVNTNNNDSLNLKVSDISALDNINCAKLIDLKTGYITNLKSDTLYSFWHTLFDNGHRFNLVLRGEAQVDIENTLCYDGSEGSAVLLDSSSYTFYSWSNENGFLSNQATIENLSPGDYYLMASSVNCGLDTIEIEILNGLDNFANLDVVNCSCSSCCDGEIHLPQIPVGAEILLNGQTYTLPLNGLCDGTYTLNYVDEKLCEQDTIIYLGVVNGIEEQEISCSVYPNPVKSKLEVQADFTLRNWALINPAGKVILSDISNNKQTQIDVEGLSEGIYFLQLNFDEGKATRKILIRR